MTNDLKKVAKEKAEQNKETLEQAFTRNYQKFLLQGKLSAKEKVEIMLYDNNQSTFDKINKRLEVLETTKKQAKNSDLTSKESTLLQCSRNEPKTNETIAREYQQMNQPSKEQTAGKKQQQYQQERSLER